jgi:hypothetical protein
MPGNPETVGRPGDQAAGPFPIETRKKLFQDVIDKPEHRKASL